MPEYRSPQARAGAIGAHLSWANTVDRTARTEAARKAAAARFEAQVDPAITDPQARAQAAEHLRRAHFLRMSAASAKARRARKAA
jgi:hypothetical protein